MWDVLGQRLECGVLRLGDTWVERAKVLGEGVREHWDAVLDEVGARRTCLGFVIEGSVWVDKEGHVGNVYPHLPSRICKIGAWGLGFCDLRCHDLQFAAEVST